MAKWRVAATVIGSKYLGEFEAKTKKEAEALAFESQQAGISLCHQCSHECEDADISEVFAERVPERKKRTPTDSSSP